MLDEVVQLIAARITVEEERGDDWYEKRGCRNGLVEPFLPLLAEFNAVDILEDVERPIPRDDLDTKFTQAPQRCNCATKELVV